MPTQFEKYIFKGSATALRGNIRKPNFQELGNHLAIITYAGAPANIRCTNDQFAFEDKISYVSATTSIVTTQSGDYFECESLAQVSGLRVGGRLTAELVTSRLRSIYDKRRYPDSIMARVSPAGSTIRNLQIDGKPLEVKLPSAFTMSDDAAGEFLYGRCADETPYRPNPALIPEPFAIQNFGTIYYAEWVSSAQQPGHQILTMMRLALGSDFGADADVGCTDNNGTGYPPKGS